MEASDVISTYVYRVGLIGSEFSLSAAVGSFNSVINCMLLVIVNSIARKNSETSLLVGGSRMNTVLKKNDIIMDIAVHTILVLVMLLTLYPLIYVISASLSNPMNVVRGDIRLFPIGFNFNSYITVFKDNRVLVGYKNTIIYTIVGTAVNLVVTTGAAYALSRKDLAGRRIMTLIFMVTMFFNGGLIPTYITITKMGLYDKFLVMILPKALDVWNLMLMKSFFQTTIPSELEDAARIDGCSNIGMLYYVVLPLSTAIIAVMVMFYGVNHWNGYFTALIYLKDKAKFPLQLVLREILIQDNKSMVTDETLLMQQLSAESIKYSVIIISSLPMLVLYPFLQKYFVKGVMVGAIKG